MTTMPLLVTLRRLTTEPRSLRPFRRSFSIGAVACLALLPFSPPAVHAQEPAGAVAGRVLNSATQRFVNNARVTVQGTTRQTFTGEDGSYLLSELRPGQYTLVVQYAGAEDGQATVTIRGGATVDQDFTLRTGPEEIVTLEAFKVAVTRETDAGAIAINEQRAAPNIKNVISTDSFGEISNNSLGEFLKYLPAIGVEYKCNEIVAISVRGLGSEHTEVKSNGFASASANTDERYNTRTAEMAVFTTTDLARAEVRKVPLPSDSANAIGGSVNLVRRSAFEYKTRKVNYKVSLNGTGDNFTTGRSPGFGDERRRKIQPSFQVGIVDPVSRTLGYSLTAAFSQNVSPWYYGVPYWNYGTVASNASASPGSLPTLKNPGVQNPLQDDTLVFARYKSLGLNTDWKVSDTLTLSPSFGYSHQHKEMRDTGRFQWYTGTLVACDRTTSKGAIGGGMINYNNYFEGFRNSDTDKYDASLTAKWRWNAWTAEAGGMYSYASQKFSDIEHGFFAFGSEPDALSAAPFLSIPARNISLGAAPSTGSSTPAAKRTTVNLYDNGIFGPGRVEVLDAAGSPVEWWKAANHTLKAATSRPSFTETYVRNWRGNVKRSFYTRIPFSIELGATYEELYRDRKRDCNTWTFVGADGITDTADDSAGVIASDVIPAVPNTRYGYPAYERLSMTKYYNLYKAHPEYFRYEDAASYKRSALQAFSIREQTNAHYVQADARLFNNRVHVTGGLRYERTKGEGYGYLYTPNAIYAKNPDGSVDKNRRLPGVASATEKENLTAAMLIYQKKGARNTGSFDGYFPSLHVGWDITDHLVFRPAYARTQAKPDFGYSLIPYTSIDESAAIPTINYRNPKLRPWVAHNFDFRLEHYRKQGYAAVGWFVKNIDDFHVANTVTITTEAQAAEYGLDPQYVGWRATNRINGGTARLTGLEIELQQSLDEFLPKFARGFSLRSSFNANDLDGQPPYANFGMLARQRATSWLSYDYRQIRAGIGYIYEGRIEIADRTSSTGGQPSVEYFVPRHLFDVSFEYRLSRRLTAFLAGKNITDEARTRKNDHPAIPSYAKVQLQLAYGANYEIGIKGSF